MSIQWQVEGVWQLTTISTRHDSFRIGDHEARKDPCNNPGTQGFPQYYVQSRRPLNVALAREIPSVGSVVSL